MEGLKRHWLIILGLAALIVAGSFWGHWQKTAVPEKTASVVPAQPAADGRPVVYVSGAVNKPGLYKIAPGSRVIDAINAAGGLALGADANRVNLAQAVRDGLQIHVPVVGAPAAPPGEAGKVSINAAGAGELEKLPGIGPVLAQRILDYRKANGPFRAIGDLKKVTGIGDSKYDQIKDKITL
jgi:competence protein ComEA